MIFHFFKWLKKIKMSVLWHENYVKFKYQYLWIILLEHIHIHYLYISVTAFALQGQHWVFAIETIQPTKPKMFIIWPYTEKVWGLLSYSFILPIFIEHLLCIRCSARYLENRWKSYIVPTFQVNIIPQWW